MKIHASGEDYLEAVRSLIQPVTDGLCEFLEEALEGFSNMPGEIQKAQERSYANEGMSGFIRARCTTPSR